jgi:hypothetical protein
VNGSEPCNPTVNKPRERRRAVKEEGMVIGGERRVFGWMANFQRKGPSTPFGTTGLKLHTERKRANSVRIQKRD